jgi:hypothetical protein
VCACVCVPRTCPCGQADVRTDTRTHTRTCACMLAHLKDLGESARRESHASHARDVVEERDGANDKRDVPEGACGEDGVDEVDVSVTL